ncbi:hypothetical protein [Pontibacter flavimaris]|uniref:STAS/SEC14 domain-containing protein n=1 Tax=Pontibacter flavimaris TaxID=1797110 RepID=A0A1Q5PHW1_9BACT|nr:hypothetical protein [Pontibacter flavimaris]OKL41742.1 hypothetical protein A3841_12010 [Pontibacter flavimaris]
MALISKYHSDFYKIEVDEARKLLKAVWLRPVSAEEAVLGGTRLYEVLRDTGMELAIADARVITTLSSDTKDWLSSQFYKLLSDTKLKRLARVVPSALYAKVAVESVVTRAEALGVTRFEVKNFSSPGEALSWLMN